MISRARKMVELASRKGNVANNSNISCKQKYNILLRPRTAAKAELVKKPVEERPIYKNKIDKILNSRTTTDENNFMEIVNNETSSSFVSSFMWNETESSRICNEYLIATSPIVNMESDSENESFDDSIVDPDYIELNLREEFVNQELSNEDSSNEDSSNEDSSNEDEAMEQMGEALESNLLNNINISSNNNSHINNQKTRKLRRNAGQSYETSKGILIKERKCIPLNSCRNRCSTKLDYDDQKKIFNEYWALASYNLRCAYISGLVELWDKKNIRNYKNEVPKKNRRFTCKYHVIKNGQKITLCKKCFKHTLGETEKFLNYFTNKQFSSATFTVKDLRGSKSGSSRLLSQNIVDQVKEHINSFPAYQSHYTRRYTDKKYLHSDLNLTQMHKMYLENCVTPVSIWKYSEIFKKMNIKFKKPSTDACHTCETLNLKLKFAEQNKDELLEQQSQHHKAADIAYKSKEFDKNVSKSNKDVVFLTFDMQKCLPTPHLNTSVSFYKRLLWTYNLTVHDGASNQSHNYMWHEAIGNRGGNEVASCLLLHLKNLPANIKHVILYSDSCAGQNKNSFVATMFMLFLQENTNIEHIDHKFLEVGHTHMECDIDHAAIERKRKWIRYTVKWIRFTHEYGVIQYKNSLDGNEPFKTLNIKRRGILRQNLDNVNLCYSEPIKISSQKKKDLLDLLPLIDPEYRPFYQNLTTDTMPDIHPDLLDELEVGE